MRLVSTDMGLDAKLWVFHLGCVFLNFFCISGEIQLLNECCSVGTRWAIEKTHCDDYKYATDDIPRVWRGLCLTTLGMCCEKELGNQHCIAGRAAAREGSKCVGDHKFNSTFYTNCCKACQIGLAVAASGSNCSSTSLSYFTHDESYTICCNDNTNDDNTFILAENDDICGKVQNLCSHICENTRDSYACKCRPGFKLDENKVTCSPDENVAPIESDEDDETHEDCKVGYERNPRTKECGDIDECLEATSVCRNDQYCYNTPGSYSCLNIRSTECDTGFRFNTKTEACEDINECHDNPCAEGYTCINYAGHYDCRRSGLSSVRDRTPASPFPVEPCDPGYRFKHNKCIDIDECLTDKNACDSNQICVNVEGAYRCNCKIGFKMDATFNACVDLNECQINNHNCLPSQRCDNTIGSYTCIRLQSCGTGYTLNAETGNCDDDDECLLGRDDCPPSYTCRNTEGSFRCDRNKTARIFGTFTSTPTSSTVTSTISTSSSRSTKASTLPTPSKTPTTPRPTPIHIVPNYTRASSSHTPFISYQTRNTQEYVPSSTHRFTPDASCGYGFERNRMGACVDVDECQIQGGVCGSHQRCINTNGSYRCQNLLVCPGGYRATPNGTSCVDIDECETGEHNCGPDQTCRNRMGGYVCSCPPGHILSSGNRCVDINECEYQREQVCSINSNCINTVGSYYCECKPGFKKHNQNDKNCVDVDECEDVKGLCEQKCVNFWGSYRCACNPGFELASDNRTCTDINECEVHKSYNLCMGFCNNVPGSYECSCPPGYELGLDKNSCRDIDECSLPNICLERNEICTNIRGSYRCNVISCPYGYSLDPDQKNRCRLINHVCEGEECFQKPSAYTYNFITLVSKMLIPPQGRTLFTLRGPTWYENIDFDLKIARITAPANVEKATDQYFSTNKMHNQVQLSLMRSLEGPQDIELELSMTVFMNDHPRGKSVAKILIIVSQYSF